ncbi:diguanylate cyclase [Novimethylophilus kurashikiensis]|uniref:Diguanylate cyclase n=1 Tax=Novimethylophilus kurashikiensis TaxID=1825523 RepID=A0A2R5F1S0_9PROT|nr:sensor domain-containing diguanylate cyclase [Novimethylophilus kurashikiensis]GBG12620.1 diguanylate cyclase [Novimethylophilus kurashikiensis]
MLEAPIPENEKERIASLRRMLLLATPDEAIFNRITRIAQQFFNTQIVLISLLDENRQWFKSCVGLPVRETPRNISFCGHAIMQDDILVVEDALDDERFRDNPLVTGDPMIRFYAGRPLRNFEGHKVGTLCLIDPAPRTLNFSERLLLDDLGHLVEDAFVVRELKRRHQEVLDFADESIRDSYLDPMLNIWNRRAITSILEQEKARSERDGNPFSILLLDLDRFKQINDTHGHLIGDKVLASVTSLIVNTLRPYDHLGRFGGEEFLVVLPNTSQQEAISVAERIRAHVAEQGAWVAGSQFGVTVSIGVMGWSPAVHALELEKLLQGADDLLYASKRGGRNRVSAVA